MEELVLQRRGKQELMLFPFIRLMENTEIGKSVYNIIFRIEAGAIIKAGAFIMINKVFSLQSGLKFRLLHCFFTFSRNIPN